MAYSWLTFKVTYAIIERVSECYSQELDAVYPIVYLALGVNMEGHKELLGMWLFENDGAKFWLSALTELKNRSVQSILIDRVNGLKGFPNTLIIFATLFEDRLKQHIKAGSYKEWFIVT